MKIKQHFLLFVLILLVTSACAGAPQPTPTPTPTPITYALGYINDVQFAPLYVAIEKGYFASEGINMELAPIFEDQAIEQIASNELQFGTIGADQVILARAQELPLVYVATWYQGSPIALVGRGSLGLESLADLKRHNIGIAGLFGASYLGLRALLQVGGIQEGEVTLDQIGFTQYDAFTSGQEDVVIVYANNEVVRFEANDEDMTVFNVSDFVQLAGNGIVTNEETIRSHPELVQGMVSAMLHGLSDTIANPDEAFTISKKYVESLASADAAETSIQKQVLAASIDLWKTDTPGISDEQAWENTLDLLIQMGLLSTAPDLTKAYTNEFVP